MQQAIAHITLVVNDYDDAIDFYVNKLQFDLVEDTQLSLDKRWVLVRPKGTSTCSLLLAQASTEIQRQAVGNQTGGRVALFLQTDDFQRDYKALQEANVTFVREAQEHDYGIVAVFEDLYGNQWDLIQRFK